MRDSRFVIPQTPYAPAIRCAFAETFSYTIYGQEGYDGFMKRNLYAVFLAAAMLCSLFTATAETQTAFECSFMFDSDTGIVTLKGSASSTLTVYVAEESVQPETFSFENPPTGFQQFKITKPTEFSYTLPLSKELKSGIYTVYVTSNNEKKQFSFKHISETEAISVCEALNQAVSQSAEEVYKILDTNKKTLLLAEEELQKHGRMISNIFYNRKYQFRTVAELLRAFDEGTCISLIQTNLQKENEALLEEKSSVLGIDFQKHYASLNTDAKLELLTLLKTKTDYLTRPLSEIFPEYSALSAMKHIRQWQECKTIITDTYKDILQIDVSGTKNADSVFRAMSAYPYNSFADIKENFYKAQNEINKPSGGGSGSSSGGAGNQSGGGVAAIGTPSSEPPANTNTEQNFGVFTDIPQTHWAKNEIQWLVAKNILNGYPDGSFSPENKITRSEFAKILSAAFALQSTVSLPFTDVQTQDWYYPYIQKAYGSGIIKGVSDTSFAPEDYITRQDACVMLWRILSAKKELPAAGTSFVDADEISSYAQPAINALYTSGIVKGMENHTFLPQAFIDRQSAAMLIYQGMNY